MYFFIVFIVIRSQAFVATKIDIRLYDEWIHIINQKYKRYQNKSFFWKFQLWCHCRVFKFIFYKPCIFQNIESLIHQDYRILIFFLFQINCYDRIYFLFNWNTITIMLFGAYLNVILMAKVFFLTFNMSFVAGKSDGKHSGDIFSYIL